MQGGMRQYNKEYPLRVFEAFSGYGSQSLAFKYLKDLHPDFEFEVVGISDIEESADKAYHLIHGEHIKNYGDVTKIDWDEVPDFDLISWSTPCQDFSMAGLRRGGEEGSGTRSSLIFEERRMLKAKHPKFVMLENVKGLLTKKMMPFFQKYLQDLESFGYANFCQVLNAKDYGVPQNRERVFVISIRRDGGEPEPTYTFPKPIPLRLCVEDVVEDEVDENFYLCAEQVEKFTRLADMGKFIEEYEQSKAEENR